MTANGTSTSAITVQAKDAFGNDLTSSGGPVALATSRGALSGVSNNADGTYSATLTSSPTAGTANVTGTIGGTAIANPTSVSFVPGSASAAHTVISASPSSLTADGTSTSTITVQAKDVTDNNLTGSGGLVTLATTLGSLSAVTDNGNGTYTATLTSSVVAGTAGVTGTIGGTAIGHTSSVAFTAGTVSASHSTVIGSAATASTDTGSTVAVTVTVTDAHDNPIQGSLVQLAQGGGTTSSISNPLGIATDANGQAVFTVSDTVAESVVYSATATGTLVTQTAGVGYQAGVPAKVAFGQQPSNAVSASAVTPAPTVRILDAHDNLTSSTASISVAIKAGTGTAGASLAGTATHAAVAGVATFSGLSIDKAGSGYVLTATSGSFTSDSSSFAIAPGTAAAAHSTLGVVPATITADDTSVSTITIRAKDVNDNSLTTGGATVAVSFSPANSNVTLSSVTDNGNGTYTATIKSSQATTVTVSGTLNGSAVLNTTPVHFVAGTIPSGANTIISASPVTLTTDTATSAITVQSRDTLGNDLSAGGATVTLTTDLGSLDAVVDNGDGTYTATLTSTSAGVAHLTGKINGATIGHTTSVTFTPGAANAAHTVISAAPATLVANGTSTSTITVQAKDAHDNNLTTGGDTAVIGATVGTISAVHRQRRRHLHRHPHLPRHRRHREHHRDAQRHRDRPPGLRRLHPGRRERSSHRHLGGTGHPRRQRHLDLHDHRPRQGRQRQRPHRRWRHRRARDQPRYHRLGHRQRRRHLHAPRSPPRRTAGTATSPGRSTAPRSAIRPRSPSPRAPPAQPTPSSRRPRPPSSPTAPRPRRSPSTSRTSTTTTSPPAAPPSRSRPAAVPSARSPTTATAPTRATLTSSTSAGTASVTGTLNGTAIGHPTSVAFTPSGASAAHTVISAAPATLVANGTSTSTITVHVKDVNDNDLTAGGATVALATSRGSIGSVTDNGDGTYSATLTSSTSAGTANVTGTLNGTAIGHPTSVAFTPSAANAAHTVISATPAAGVVADGITISTVTVQAKDLNDNNLGSGGATVTLATSRGTLSAVTDNGDGTYSATLTSTSAGAASITGTLNGSAIGTSAAVTFVPGAIDAFHSTVVASSAAVSTDAGNSATVTVKVRDAHNNPITNAHVVLDQGIAASTISSPLGLDTDASGQAVFTVSDTLAEPVVYSATASSTLVNQSASVQFLPGTPTQLVYGQQATNATAGSAIAPAITVRILDAQNNLTPNTTDVTLAIKSGTGSTGAALAGTSVHAAVAGVATFPGLSIAKAGTGYKLTASTTSTSSTDGAAFDIAPGAVNPAHTTITASPASINADGTSGTSTITVHAKDAFDNDLGISGGSVTLTRSRGSLSSVSDNGDGTYTATLTATGASGVSNIAGTIGGIAIGHPTAVTFVPPVPTVTIDAGTPPAQTQATAASFDFHSPNDDGNTTFECSLDGAAFTACTSPTSYTGLADGDHTFRVHGVNDNGPGSNDHASWTVDTHAPSVSLTTAPGAYTNQTTVNLVAAASDVTTGVASVDFRFAATAAACPTGTTIFTDLSSPFAATWTTPSDGTYVVCAVALDEVGNVSTPATSAVVVDQTTPTTTLATFGRTVGPDTYVKGSPALHATSSDATSGVNAVDFSFAPGSPGTIASLTGTGTPATADSYDTTWPTGALADGTYTVTAKATDKATNTDSASRTVIVDNTPPVASLDAPTASGLGHGTIPLSITASDGGSGVETAATVIQSSPHGTGTWTTIAAPATWTPADGDYDLQAIVKDNAGNQTTTATRRILVDNTPPVLSDNADALWHSSDVTVALTATDAESGVQPADVQYKVDSGSFTTGTSVLVAAPSDGSNDGTHTITWHATNRAGVPAADKTTTVKIDHTPPSNVVLDAPTAGSTLHGTLAAAGLAATAQDGTGSGIATTTFRIAPAGTLGTSACDTFGSAITAPFDSTTVADGHYDFWVAAADNAGNGRCSVVPHDVLIDNTAPVTTDNAPAGAQRNDVTVTLAATDNLTGVTNTEYSLDNGATWSPGTSVTILASSSDGTHTISYRSTDGAGNVEATKSTSVDHRHDGADRQPDDPGSVLRGTVDADRPRRPTRHRHRRVPLPLVGGSGPYTSIGIDTTAPYDVHVAGRDALADGVYDVEEIVTDTAGNATTVALAEDGRQHLARQRPCPRRPPRSPTSAGRSRSPPWRTIDLRCRRGRLPGQAGRRGRLHHGGRLHQPLRTRARGL